MSKGIFIVGTDTEVGKTIITSSIMYLLIKNGYKATYFKAALSGVLQSSDSNIPGDGYTVKKISGLEEDYDNIVPYIYKTEVSPHLAAKIENKPIKIEVIKEKYNLLKEKYEYIVAEGSGGIICPLIDDDKGMYNLYDLIKDLNMNVIVVTRASVGTINHTILTIKFIESIGIKIKGIIVNNYEDNYCCKDNIKIIKRLTNVPIISVFPKLNIKLQNNLDSINENIDIIRKESEKNIDVKNIINLMGQL